MPPTTSNNSLVPKLTFFNCAKNKVKFDEGCLEQYKITFNHGNIVNKCVVYDINLWPKDQGNKFALLNY